MWGDTGGASLRNDLQRWRWAGFKNQGNYGGFGWLVTGGGDVSLCEEVGSVCEVALGWFGGDLLPRNI